MNTRVVIAFVIALILGAVLALSISHLLQPDPAPQAEQPIPEAPPPPPPPRPIEPGTARTAVLKALTTAGVSSHSIQYGVFPLRGTGRQAGETIPLISFTCPSGTQCADTFRAIESTTAPAGLTLVKSARPDVVGRPAFRALSANGRPALAIRAFPAGPRLSVVVTGLGADPGIVDALTALDTHVTFGVLATAIHAHTVAERLQKRGREVIAELPMEPMGEAAPVPGTLTTKMSPEEIGAQVSALLKNVPGAVGISNHQGGRLTTSRQHMSAVLEALRERALYILDRRTSPASLAIPTARAMGIRGIPRTHEVTGGEGDLQARLRAIEAALVLDGHAVVVVEPDVELIVALKTWLTKLNDRKIRILRLSEVVF